MSSGEALGKELVIRVQIGDEEKGTIAYSRREIGHYLRISWGNLRTGEIRVKREGPGVRRRESQVKGNCWTVKWCRISIDSNWPGIMFPVALGIRLATYCHVPW